MGTSKAWYGNYNNQVTELGGGSVTIEKQLINEISINDQFVHMANNYQYSKEICSVDYTKEYTFLYFVLDVSMTNSYTGDCSAYEFNYGFCYFVQADRTPSYTSVIIFNGLNNTSETRHHILYGTSLNMYNENYINKISLAASGAKVPGFTINSTGVLKVYECNLIL